MSILIVTAVDAEAAAIRSALGNDAADVRVVAGGVGRTNAAAATTEALLAGGPFAAVINAGVAGALPDGGLTLGQSVVASGCVYVEEGMRGPDGLWAWRAWGCSWATSRGTSSPSMSVCSRRWPSSS